MIIPITKYVHAVQKYIITYDDDVATSARRLRFGHGSTLMGIKAQFIVALKITNFIYAQKIWGRLRPLKTINSSSTNT